ncbi:Pre-mRNA-processing ATP-dependent RNA helicase PRP5 [Beauveria bassiana D1-5]|uniref:RNA helicase n=1 Tax=Beauveria bassiana D1-5 TaxID=1245745 RepID=A0A0A2VTH5_BEABA|nr:Pre-mRNA-processing ATP-dependent RNA helicase PRP5 [Beauveria bassiana D1-5]
MARPRDSRSPSLADSHGARRHRDDRRPRDRGDDRGYRRRSRSRTPEVSQRHLPTHPRSRRSNAESPSQKRYRDRDGGRDRDHYRRRDRSRSLDKDHDRYRGGRDRRRSRDRYDDRARPSDGRRNRSRDDDRRRSGSRGRDSRGDDSRSDSRGRNTPRTDSGRKLDEPPKQTGATTAQADAEKKKAERLAKLEAWKKKKELEAQKPKEVNPLQTRSLLAEMDKKSSGMPSDAASPAVSSGASPTPGPDSGNASPVRPYAGKFDPKSIAKKSAARTHDATKSILGSINPEQGKLSVPVKQSTASALPANRAKTSAFGFGKSQGDEKLPSKRKLDLDEEETTKRKLTKLPSLPVEADDTPYVDQDDDDDDNGDEFAENEEEAAAAARAAHERRLQAEEEASKEADGDQAMADAAPTTNGTASIAEENQMEVDEEDDDVDPLDAFMDDLQHKEFKRPAAKKASTVKKLPEPEAYFSDDDYGYEVDQNDADASAVLAMTNKRKKKEIPTVDYSKIDIQPIRKNFWVEPVELSELNETEVAELRAELDGIKVNGKDVPKPVQKWAQCGLTRQTLDLPEPEAYFSDDDYGYEVDQNDADASAVLAMTNKRKKKEIPTVDYSKIDIQPIRKNFWVEPVELSELNETEVAELRAELDGIKVNGKDVPKPVQKWAQCGLTRQTLDVIDNMGFEKPTSIQMQAIPALMSGRDVIGVAKTGSGKTMAFLLPMFRHIKDQPPLKESEGPVGLIMTPTRELATQIHRDCKPFLKMMGMRAVCAYGGAPIRDQIAELKRGAEIIVCTPGRMIDLLAANQGRVTNLRRVTYVVLDEADRMFDMGFEPQVMKIFANMRPDKQTILFSATMPRIIDSLTKKVLKSPVEITVGGRSVVAKEIEQIVEVRDENTKFHRVLELLGELYDRDEDARSLIFVERQEKADDLLKELMVKGYPCMSIHGGKDQVDRDSTISDFKKGVVPILVATSVAARGLDVKQLKLVINYDAPNHLEDYVHRAGRTGRAGNTGVAVTFITPEQESCAPGIAKALEQSEQPVPERLNEMRKAHREKVKSGKAKDTSGFGGKGLDRLDQEREAARMRERKTHKADGEDEDEKKEDKKEEDDTKHERALDAIKAAASGIQSRDSAKAEPVVNEPVIKTSGVVASNPGASKGGAAGSNPLDKVSSAVSAINSRLGKAGQLRSGQPIDNKGPDAGAFHATLEINDFPQKARWAVTNRTNVAKILENTGVSITTKGNFYAAGKEVPEGAEPKLYILIEGDTELVVGSALNELTRLLKEATIAAADADSRAPASGRYTIT